jgi:hypothetical protein
MSFDVHLQKFADGHAADANREGVRAVLQSTAFVGPDEFGFYVVTFPDDIRVELSASGLDGTGAFTGCAFFIRGMSSDLVRFIFEVARAGDMVILPAMEHFVPILSSPEQRAHLPADLTDRDPAPVVCDTPEGLESLLSGGYEGWKKYRDQILNKNPKV